MLVEGKSYWVITQCECTGQLHFVAKKWFYTQGRSLLTYMSIQDYSLRAIQLQLKAFGLKRYPREYGADEAIVEGWA